MPFGPNDESALHEGLGALNTDTLGGKVGADLRTARDFAQSHPIPKDGKILEDVELTGGGTTDTIEHGLGREPVGVELIRTDTEMDVPAYAAGSTVSKPNESHMTLTSNATGPITCNLLVY